MSCSLSRGAVNLDFFVFDLSDTRQLWQQRPPQKLTMSIRSYDYQIRRRGDQMWTERRAVPRESRTGTTFGTTSSRLSDTWEADQPEVRRQKYSTYWKLLWHEGFDGLRKELGLRPRSQRRSAIEEWSQTETNSTRPTVDTTRRRRSRQPSESSAGAGPDELPPPYSEQPPPFNQARPVQRNAVQPVQPVRPVRETHASQQSSNRRGGGGQARSASNARSSMPQDALPSCYDQAHFTFLANGNFACPAHPGGHPVCPMHGPFRDAQNRWWTGYQQNAAIYDEPSPATASSPSPAHSVEQQCKPTSELK